MAETFQEVTKFVCEFQNLTLKGFNPQTYLYIEFLRLSAKILIPLFGNTSTPNRKKSVPFPQKKFVSLKNKD